MKQAYEYLVSLATITLVLAGISGVSFHAFRDRGWIELALDRIWSFQLDHPMVAIPVTLAAALAFHFWRNHHLTQGGVNRVPALLVYCLMGAGAYFLGQFALHSML